MTGNLSNRLQRLENGNSGNLIVVPVEHAVYDQQERERLAADLGACPGDRVVFVITGVPRSPGDLVGEVA